MSKKFFIFSLLIVVSLIAVGCQAGAAAPEVCAENPDETVCAVISEGSTIKIGYAGPMAGDYSAFGIDISNAGLLAVDDANEAGGFEGFEFELLVEDTGGSGEGGASVANLYVSDPDVVAIAGHTFSGSTAAAIPIYNEARLPMLSPSATRADLTEGPQNVFNRIPFTDDIQGQFASEYLYNVLGVNRLAIMHDGDAYGKGLAEKVQEVFMGLGGEVVAFEAVTPGETDYSAVLTDVGAADPDAIYFGGYFSECAVIAQGMPVAGMEDVILFSDDGTYGQTFIELAGVYAEGVFAATSVPGDSAAKVEFDAYFESVYGDVPGDITGFTWHGYDVVDALIESIKSVAILGGDGNLYVPREALVEAVNTLTAYQGLTGELTCNGGECNATGPTFQVVRDGMWAFP
jgi:branched-chain amino acid transport system substrate-binding protein